MGNIFLCLSRILVECRKSSTRSAQEQSSPALKNSPLGKLPHELIVIIASCLPLAYAGTFAVTCRSILNILGPEYVTRARTFDSDRSLFLYSLAKELPDRIFCMECKHCHIVDEADPYIYPDRNRFSYIAECVSKDLDTGIYLFVHCDIGRSIFDMAMKRHRLRLDCEKYFELISKTSTRYQKYATIQRISGARIVQDSMFIRAQYVIYIPIGNLNEWPKDFNVIICPHTGCMSRIEQPDNDMKGKHGEGYRALKQVFRQWQNERVYLERLIQCGRCRTEYQIDLKNFQRRQGLAVFITKWLELGTGTNDSRWKAHTWTGKSDDGSLPLGSIKNAFEEGRPFVFDSLLTCKGSRQLFHVDKSS